MSYYSSRIVWAGWGGRVMNDLTMRFLVFVYGVSFVCTTWPVRWRCCVGGGGCIDRLLTPAPAQLRFLCLSALLTPGQYSAQRQWVEQSDAMGHPDFRFCRFQNFNKWKLNELYNSVSIYPKLETTLKFVPSPSPNGAELPALYPPEFSLNILS